MKISKKITLNVRCGWDGEKGVTNRHQEVDLKVSIYTPSILFIYFIQLARQKLQLINASSTSGFRDAKSHKLRSQKLFFITIMTI